MAKAHIFAISQRLADGKEVGLLGHYSAVIHWAPPTSLPSASRRKRFFAICWQMAKNWLMATRFFAICQFFAVCFL